VPVLQAAEQHPHTQYLAARAEQLSLRDVSADLVTIAAAFHWFDQPRVFAELARVLRGGAGLVVYSDFFHDGLAGRPAFTDWLKASYLPRFPMPARHAYFDAVTAVAAGFGHVTYAEEKIRIPLTRSQLADYLVSQSNATIAIESGAISAEDLHRAIAYEIAPFFPDHGRADAVFGIRVWTAVLRP
jgi:SAM-dependent methyltransferase